MVDLKRWTENNVCLGFQKKIFDRHRLISEPIYGSIMRSNFEPGFGDLTWLHMAYANFYNHCKPLIIYCLPSYDVVRANLKEDEDNRTVFPKIRRIYSLYVSAAARDLSLGRAIWYDYTQHSPMMIHPWINKALEELAHV